MPEWLAFGLGVTVVVSAAITALFVVGVRRYPTRRTPVADHTDDAKRRAEIRAYLSSIGERYAENFPVDGHTVDFYLPDRDVAVTFDARTYFRIESTGTHPVLVEHELPGAQIGHRLPFDTPRPERPVNEPTEAAFETLALPTSASPNDIEQAYREKVKDVHPDHGGDVSTFLRLRKAYAAAKSYATNRDR